MNRMRRYNEKDIYKVQCRDEGWGDVTNMLAVNSWSWTFLDDDGPWAICGAMKRWEGCASVWMTIDKRMSGFDKGKFMTKACKTLIKMYCDLYDVERVDCIVDSKYEGYDRWAEVLGFELDYISHKASPNCDSDIMGFVYWRHKNGKQTQSTRD